MQKTMRQKRAEVSARRKELVEFYGPDVYELGTVVRFYKCFGDPSTEQVYTYVAIKVEHDWFCGGKYLAWSELLLELDTDNQLAHDGILEVATDWIDHPTPSEPPF